MIIGVAMLEAESTDRWRSLWSILGTVERVE